MTDQDSYLVEARELLAELEASLLELERTPEDQELIGRVFRALHTIKGSGAMFGFDHVAAFTHDVENAFDLVRAGRLAVSPELIGITLEGRDHIRVLLEGGEPEAGAGIVERLRRLVGNRAPGAHTKTEPKASHVAGPRTFRVHFQPAADCFLKGTNPLLLVRELCEMGQADVTAETSGVPDLESLDPERCYTSWDIVLTTAHDENAIRGVFLFVEDDSEISIERVEAEREKKLGEILIERGEVPAERVQAALAEQQHLHRHADATVTIRVPAEKLDQLVNIVGELVTVQARLSALAGGAGDPELMFVAEEVERLTGKLRNHSMSVRMLPIGETFSKFKRIVRDLSASLGKQVELVMEGGDTEIDKTVIDQLSDPLVHLIRNAIDHGIEVPDERAAAGKPARGTVVLSAVHSGAHVLIRMHDDGAGLDPEAIRALAVERGLVAADAELTEEQVFGLIFEPGFSTARKVTEVSGRGVGLDVVKRGIEALHGSLQIASRRGEGTTITLKLPLTLAIIDGLLVRVGEESFVLPLSNIVGCIERTAEDIRNAHGKDYVVVRGEMVACIPLRRHFGIAGEAPPIEQVIIAETHYGKCGFTVDEVIGHHQTVIKKLGGLCRKMDLISGATILGDGTVALILDADRLAAA
jgi:two-component system, chemotaxis family, sensor kinase CheA